jgi:prolyl oligopeptidase
MVLLTTALRDPRVEPWQVAKMTAQLQEATASKNPVLLRVPFEAGHGLSSTQMQVEEQRATEYAFVLWRTGTRVSGQQAARTRLLGRSTGLA